MQHILTNLFPGYPYQGPRTGLGKLLSIGIACIGLPIFLLYICLVGRFLGRHLETFYNKVVCCNRRSRRQSGDLSKEPGEDRRKVPGWFCLLTILLYLMLGTLLMCHIHDVSLIDGLLYTFSLMVTIGVTLDSDTDLLSILLTCVYIILGVAIMSMCAYCLSQDLATFLRSLTTPS